MDNQLIPWIIEIKELETRLRTEEGGWQAVRIDLSIRALTPALPHSIEECLDYQPICRWMLDEWPQLPPAPLDARLLELARFIFDTDARAEWIAAAVGNTAVALSRHEYEAVEDMRTVPVRYARAA